MSMQTSPGSLPDGVVPAPELVAWVLAGSLGSTRETAAAVEAMARTGSRQPRATSQAIVGFLEDRELLEDAGFTRELMERRDALEETPLGLRILAQISEFRGRKEEALGLFQRLDEPGTSFQDTVVLDVARLLARLGRPSEAAEALRRAAGLTSDFAFLTRAANQFARLKDGPRSLCPRTLRVALLYPYTTDLWLPLLRLLLFRDGIWPEVMTPPYGAFEQAILDPGSSFYGFRPEVVLLAQTARDLNLPAFSTDPTAAVEERVEQIVHRWRILKERFPVRIIQHNFEVPAVDPNGQLGYTYPGGRAALIQRINERLWEEADRHRTTLVNVDRTASAFGKQAWSDPSLWFSAKQYPAPAALPALVEAQVARIRASLGLTRKVLVLDLDNTLWGGVIGEDGLKGIQVGPPSARGEAHKALQQYALQLKERGILLAVCSKNNQADAESPFLQHEGMVLKLEDFVAFRANWTDKPTNLKEMARSLNLGLDSFVFMDDNPTERAFMRRELPQVAVPEIGSDPAFFVEILDRAAYFEADILSPEDLERSASYRKNLERDALMTRSASLGDFLQGLNMVCVNGPLDEHVLARVVQLLGKTNQFNLTTRRHSEEEVRRFMGDPRAWTRYFRLKDTFDDNGLVGVMAVLPKDGESGVWTIDTWLMSCRVIGRQLENFMFNSLLAAAKERGIREIIGHYLPTAKNGMVERLLPDMGFAEMPESTSECRSYRLSPAEAAFRPADFIKDQK